MQISLDGKPCDVTVADWVAMQEAKRFDSSSSSSSSRRGRGYSYSREEELENEIGEENAKHAREMAELRAERARLQQQKKTIEEDNFNFLVGLIGQKASEMDIPGWDSYVSVNNPNNLEQASRKTETTVNSRVESAKRRSHGHHHHSKHKPPQEGHGGCCIVA